MNEPFNPVFGALIALLGTLVGLFLLLSLFYTTVNPMRPVVIIEVIHELILAAPETAGSSLGPWRTSKSRPVQHALSTTYWEEVGLPRFVQQYELRRTNSNRRMQSRMSGGMGGGKDPLSRLVTGLAQSPSATARRNYLDYRFHNPG